MSFNNRKRDILTYTKLDTHQNSKIGEEGVKFDIVFWRGNSCKSDEKEFVEV